MVLIIKDSKKSDDNNFDAELTVGYKAIDEKYISRIQAEYEKKLFLKLSQDHLNL